MKELRNKNCLITGAASGIGRSFALALAKEGMNLFITDINMEGLEAVKKEVMNFGVNVSIGKCDVRSCPDFEGIASDFSSSLGNVDLLINNAGIAIGGDLLEITIEDWQKVLDVNLWSIINALRVFLPGMIKRRSGHVVNVASAAGVVGLTEPLPYIASKFAVVGLSEALYGQIHRFGVQVSVILPTYVRTNIVRNAEMRFSKEVIDEIGMEKINEIKEDYDKEFEMKSSSPDRVVKRYIRGIRKDRLYIFDSNAVLPIMAMKGTSPIEYENFLKKWNLDNYENTKKKYAEYGIDLDKFAY